MKKIVKRETVKIAIFYNNLENKEIQSLILNSFE